MDRGLVRDVIERHNNSTRTPTKPFLEGAGGSSKTGFPAVHHRSKTTSAFKRARQDDRVQSGLTDSRERLTRTISLRTPYYGSDAGSKAPKPAEDWVSEISRANEEAVLKMDPEERARERQDIIDKFGSGIDDLMVRVREARERRATGLVITDGKDPSHVPVNSDRSSASDPTSPSPRARATRKIRFAEPTEADVHVYESQPSSPKRTLALLPPPEDPQERGDIHTLGSFRGSLKAPVPFVESSVSSPHDHSDTEVPEEGTPEDIRRRFFPSEMPAESNPALAWMLPSSAPPTQPHVHPEDGSSVPQRPDSGSSQEPRYSLSGTRLTSAEIGNLPTHLGLHHHATSSPSSDTLAGYTLSDLLLLSRSSVPAQRASILGVLAKLLRHTREQSMRSLSAHSGSQDIVESLGEINLDEMRRDMLYVAIDALGEKGGVGQRGVELLWEAVVGFMRLDYGITDLDDLAYIDLSTPKQSAARSPTYLASTPVRKSQTEALDSKFLRSSPDIIMALPVAVILPVLRQHLLASPSAQSRTHTQVLEILLVLSHFEVHAREIVHADADHGVVGVMLDSHLRSSFGPEDDASVTRATPTSIHVLQALACSSRENAVKLVGTADVLLRYIIEPRTMASAQPRSASDSTTLLEETLRFYGILSRYGLYSQIATIAHDHFTRIGEWIIDAMRTGLNPALMSLSRAYVSLLGGLMVCATDPHQTTPNHDILWSQVQGWGWADWIMKVAELLAPPDTGISPYSSADVAVHGLWADLFRTTAVWVEGASINSIKGGDNERREVLNRFRPLLETGRAAQNTIVHALGTLQNCLTASGSETPSLYELAEVAGLVEASTRLSMACFMPDEATQSLQFLSDEIRALCVRYALSVSSRGYFALFLDRAHGKTLSESSCVFLKPLSTLLVSQLKLWHRSISPVGGGVDDVSAENEQWFMQAFRILRALLPGDEDHAQWIVESIFEATSAGFIRKTMPTTELPGQFWEKDGMKVLVPFLVNSLRPAHTQGSHPRRYLYIAPTWPTPHSIFRCTTLNVTSLSHFRESLNSADPSTVLPLRNDWPMLPINHLLHSGTSPVFHALPPSWDASETDVVRASLLLAHMIQRLGRQGDEDGDMSLCMSPAQAIFACMKVFMLEHGQQQLDSGEEVFRDTFISRLMEDLLEPFSYSHYRGAALRPKMDDQFTCLEQVSKAFLGSGTPFYQFYTDFLALYDAISFSHPSFARLLLPPVSMSYPVDYRKLLFGDYDHVLRTVKINVPNLLCRDIRDYLWPVERDAHVIGWYLKALITSQVYGFLRWFAVHHVAANIWPEFTKSHPPGRERAGKLLSALLQQGGNDIIRDVVFYRQREGEVLEPPNCFSVGEISWRRERLMWIQDVGGQDAQLRLQSLLLG